MKLLLSLLFASPTSASPLPCGTLQQLALAPQASRAPLSSLGSGRVARDPFAAPNVRYSEHFAVRWGNNTLFDEEDAEAILQDFEYGWQIEVDEMGHPAPYGTNTFYYNVYIGDTGAPVPSAYGYGGYQTIDEEGYSYIVMSQEVLFDPDYRASVAYHEFYHAIQSGTDRYTYDGEAAWFWEATAESIAVEVDPDNPFNGTFVYAYLLLPYLPVDFFDFPDRGLLQETHQYGAFLFPYHLSEIYGTEIIRDAWVLPGDETSPLEAMRRWLATRGEDLDEAWLDHLGRNVAYDYPNSNLLWSWVNNAVRYYPDTYTTAKWVSGEGGFGRLTNRAPMRYGWSAIGIDTPVDGQLVIFIDGDAQGTSGSDARYGARLVTVDGDGTHYYSVPFEGTSGTLEMTIEDVDEAWLVVGAWTEAFDIARWSIERFPFDWEIAITPSAPPAVSAVGSGEDDGRGACGCQSAQIHKGIAYSLVGWLPFARRR